MHPSRQRREQFVTVCQQILVAATVAAVVAPATAVVSLDLVAPHSQGRPEASGGPAPSLVAARPVTPRLRTVPLRPAASAARFGGARLAGPDLRTLRTTLPQTRRQRVAALSGAEPVTGLGTIGVTWDRGPVVAEEDLTVSVRTQRNGVWSRWQQIQYDPAHGPDPSSPEGARARPGTDELVVGRVDRVQVAALTPTGRTPRGMALTVVDPGVTPSAGREAPAIDTAATDADASLTSARFATSEDTGETEPEVPFDPAPDGIEDPAATPVATTAVTAKPRIFSRSQWGANERLRDGTSLRYGQVFTGFVHHTVNANNYTRRQVPALLRGVYAYHTQSRGWSDIGYNYVVDRFGRIWEGRYGGVDRPVVGAHTLDYNEYSFAMSALGNFDKVRPPQAMIDAYSRLFAWKLSLHGISSASTAQGVGADTLAAINGHRDAGTTACPGKYLYRRLADIRTGATALQQTWAGRGRLTSVSGSAWPDLLLRRTGSTTMYVLRTEGQLRFGRGRQVSQSMTGRDLVASAGDLDGDGRPDLLARDANSGTTYVYPGDGAGGYTEATTSTGQFATMDLLVGAADVNRDERADVITRSAETGQLFLFRGNGRGGFLERRALLSDARNYTLVVGAGDLTGDGNPDLVARDKVQRLWLWPGTGTADVGEPRQVRGDWSGYDQITGSRDFTGDGRADLVVRRADTKQVFVVPFGGDAVPRAPLGPFGGMKRAGAIADAGVVGSGPSLLSRTGTRLMSHLGNGRRNVSAVVGTNVDLTGVVQMLNVGDWNRDGYGDVVLRTATGELVLRLGSATGVFADPVVIATGFTSVRLLTAAGDLTGDGYPDLLGQPVKGAMRLYPGTGTGLGASYVARSAVQGATQLGVGLWGTDGAPDTLVVKRDGTTTYYPGNGPGGLTSGRAIPSPAAGYDWLVGAGDLDGDGRSDVVGRAKGTGQLWVLTRVQQDALGLPRFLAEGFAGYDLVG